jgi:hypothetical protein
MTPLCPASELFRSAEVIEVATENIMRVGADLLERRDRPMVEATVAKGLGNIKDHLDSGDPAVANELRLIQLSQVHRDAVLQSLRLLSDPRIQSVGRDVAEAIRAAADATGRATLERAIATRLRPRLGELAQLRSELVPSAVLELWGRGHQWDMTLDPENLRLMQKDPDGGRLSSNIASAADLAEDAGHVPSHLHREEKSYPVLGAVVEEARALLELVRLCTRLRGRGGLQVVPAWATSVEGILKLHPEDLSCTMGEKQQGSRISLVRALLCPLKYGAHGLDALRAVADGSDFLDNTAAM